MMTNQPIPSFGGSSFSQDEFFDKYRMAIARYSFRREFPDLVEVMLEGVPCDTLEMHFMKGWVCMQKGDNQVPSLHGC